MIGEKSGTKFDLQRVRVKMELAPGSEVDLQQDEVGIGHITVSQPLSIESMTASFTLAITSASVTSFPSFLITAVTGVDTSRQVSTT